MSLVALGMAQPTRQALTVGLCRCLSRTIAARIQFPSMEAVLAFAQDPAYAPYAQARQEGSVSRLHVIDDTDVAGTIPYLAKG